jgi:hypothetical protein
MVRSSERPTQSDGYESASKSYLVVDADPALHPSRLLGSA